MTFADGMWHLLREEPDFAPHDFRQRFVGRVGEDGDTISVAWERGPEGGFDGWERDFGLVHCRRG
ncbi:hypothetical protein ACIRP7_35815 [Streptomyces sp. NPDC102270]|uniref:hypothetical protein n=1 Tax=Streptomyces sp. NPDC102270 TaxID=3366150 RepID=UPI0037F7DA93